MGGAGSTSMPATEIQLRNELVKDTLALKRMIAGLSTFMNFNTKTCRQIDSCLLLFQNHPIMIDQAYKGPMLALKDFTNYLKNQNANLSATKSQLEGLLSSREQDDQLLSMEQSLYGFGVFVQQVRVSDAVLQAAAVDINNYIDKIQKKRKNFEDKPIEQFRDQLLVAKLMTTAMMGQNTSLDMLAKYGKSVNTDNLVFKP